MEVECLMMNNLFSLEGKTVLITGGSGYLGSVISRAAAEAGAHVVINGRNEESIRELQANIAQAGYSSEIALFDITDEEEVRSYFSKLSSLDVIINNAYSGDLGSVETSTKQQFIHSYNQTVVAANHIVQNALPLLRNAIKDRGDASVISISSMYSERSPDQRVYSSKDFANPPFYGAAKAALNQWSRYAACEFGNEGIRFNVLSVGAFPNMDVQKEKPKFIDKLNSKIPLGRIGRPEEVCSAVVFLASPGASYITGSLINIDGGWTCW